MNTERTKIKYVMALHFFKVIRAISTTNQKMENKFNLFPFATTKLEHLRNMLRKQPLTHYCRIYSAHNIH